MLVQLKIFGAMVERGCVLVVQLARGMQAKITNYWGIEMVATVKAEVQSKIKSDLLVAYLDLYGPTMDSDDLSEVFKCTKQTIYNLISSQRLPLQSFQLKGIGQQRGRRLVHTTDVVKFIEQQELVEF